jgi:hypothetical protein
MQEARKFREWLRPTLLIAALALVLLSALPVSSQAIDAPRVLADSVHLTGTGCHQYSLFWKLPGAAHGIRLTAPHKGKLIKDSHGSPSARIKRTLRRRLPGGKTLVGIRYVGVPQQCNGKGTPSRWATNSIGMHVRFERFRHVYSKFSGIRQHEPSVFYFGASQRILGMTWSDWDTRHAIGHGTYPVNDCIPYCAAGHLTDYPAQIDLSKPINCGGTWFYARFHYDTAGGPDAGTSTGGCHFLNGTLRIHGPEIVGRHLTRQAQR